jgi:hypothetical protein
MEYPGLVYPNDNNYIEQVKSRGYFILVDRYANNISLLPGGDINQLLANNNNLLFVFGKNIAGTKQDIIDSLYLSGINMKDIDNIMASGIGIANVNTPESQEWIDIFQKQNTGESIVSAAPKVLTPYVTIPKVLAPQVTIPKVLAPQVTIPKVSTPQVTIPKVLPQVTIPKVLPQVTTPKVLPQVTIPKVLPQATTPKVLPPQITIPKVSTPQVTTPKVLAPQVTTSKVLPPQVTTPKVLPSQIILPQVSQVTTPKVLVPQIILPQAPQVTISKVLVPQASQVTIPKVLVPQAPQITTPKISAPQVIVPQASQVTIPKVSAPQVILPQASQVTIPSTEKKFSNNSTTPVMEPIVFNQNNIPKEEAPLLAYPVNKNYSHRYISFYRKFIHDEITRKYLNGNPNFQVMPDILPILFNLYDQYFYQGQLSEIMNRNKIQLLFDYGAKLTKTGGTCGRNGCIYTIKISQPVILSTFNKGEKSHSANGLQCFDRLDCLMNVFEHELTHFAIEISHGHVKGDPIYKSHGLYFQQLVNAYYGQTAYKHSLLRNIETPGKKEDFSVGDIVTYQSKTGETVTNVISKLNPVRAVIGDMTVPYTIIRPASNEEKQVYNSTRKVNTAAAIQQSFRVGDIVSIDDKNGVYTDRIRKINPKTYAIGKYKASHSIVRHATEAEQAAFLRSPQSEVVRKTKNDFYLGQHVEFTSSKTGQVVRGTIQKLNPTRAIVDDYQVPYYMLRELQ